MNKQEAIEKLEQEATRTEFTEIDIEVAIKVIEELEEPNDQIGKLAYFILEHIPGEPSNGEGAVDIAIRLLSKQVKPVVPQFVADWYEDHKVDIEQAIYSIHASMERGTGNFNSDVEFWFNDSDQKPIETIIRMKDGYTVEKEKLYKVLLPGVESLNRQMCMHEETREIGFADDGYNSRKYSEDDKFIRLFTEQEIKAIDERYWAFAEEVPND